MSSPTWRDRRYDAVIRLGPVADDGAEREVRWIIEQVTGWSAAEVTAELGGTPTDRHAERFERLVTRRASGEPLQYVLGEWSFRTLHLMVDPRVLIPRPETEVVAGLAIDRLQGGDGVPVAVDLGTGSGAIALSLAAELWPSVEVWATDASADALAVARANLAGLGRRSAAVRLVDGDWFRALPDELRGGVDLVVSNPPYVAEADPLPAAVADWEPLGALVPGPSGLEAYERIVMEAPSWLRSGGWLVLEIGELQADAVTRLAVAAGLGDIEVHPDLAGRPRGLVARA